MSDTNLLEGLTEIVLAAAEVVMAIYASDFDIDVKSDTSPVTLADTEGEKIILAGLARIAPDIPVVAEEEQAGGRRITAGRRFFLVDPLDGTKEFISKNGEFTINVALVEDGEPVLGVVFAPALGRLFRGGRGLGAEVLTPADGTCRPISTRQAPADGLVVVGSRSHGSAETTRWLERFEVASFVAAGSSLKLCLVAAGEADLYPRLGRTMEWDIAAGDAVLRAAGGLVTDLAGGKLRYGKCDQVTDTDYSNPHFVAWGDEDLIRHV